MAAQFAWTQETPELDYATTESSGEHVEDFQRTPTPEAQVVGLALVQDDLVESFTGTQYVGYEPTGDEEILQDDFYEQAACALHAPIGFEGQRTTGGAYYSQDSTQRVEFGSVPEIGATAEGHTLLEARRHISLGDVGRVHSTETEPVNARLANPDYIPACFTDVQADIRCFHCGQDPTVIHLDHITPNSPSPTTSLRDHARPLPSQCIPPASPTPRLKVRISPGPASPPRQSPRAATCDWCGKTFSRIGGLPRHQASACPRRPIDVRASCFVCHQCRETRPRKDKMQLHCQRKHGQPAGKERFTEKR